MKKFTVLVVLALLAATGTSYAVTCAYDNVPGATLLVPHFKVGIPAGHTTSQDLPDDGLIDTMVAITNVSEWGVVAHVTVWNKQSVAVLDFNIPMTGYDVAAFRMRDILNGKLNVNPATQFPVDIDGDRRAEEDPCDDPDSIGTGQYTFQRFENPSLADFNDTLGYYDEPAFYGLFRTKVWTSLDEGYDYVDLVNAPNIDVYNPACNDSTGSSALTGDFTGYLTIDVTNYCTNYFPDQDEFYDNDAIATTGWGENGGPNVLMGDVFYLDANENGGNISGEAAVALEFDARLDWVTDRTFYARFTIDSRSGNPIVDDGSSEGDYDDIYAFVGDGREPLGTEYGFRYFNQAAAQSFLTVWRSDLWTGNTYNLCWNGVTSAAGWRDHEDYNDEPVVIYTWDEDEDFNIIQGGGPSGNEEPDVYPYIWWETQRIVLLGNQDQNPGNYPSGWSTIEFPATVNDQFNQAYVGISHTSPGLFVSVGHAATLLDNDFTCPGDVFTEAASVVEEVF